MSTARTVTAACAAAIAAAALSAAPAQADTVRDCRSPYSTIYDMSVRNMSCAAARKAIRRGTLTGTKQGLRTPGFSCSVISGIPISGVIRCVRGSKAFRFTFAD